MWNPGFFVPYFYYFEKNKCWLTRSLAVPLRLNDSINLYETWYVYHGTSAHLNGVHHNSPPISSTNITTPKFIKENLIIA
jgi:hypothetical protein